MVGLLLLLGLFWYWASTLIGDDSDNAGDLTPAAQAVIIDDTSTATATNTVTVSITPTETTNQPAAETPTTESGNAEETPTEKATEGSEEPVSTAFAVDDAVTTNDSVNMRSEPDASGDNIITTLDAGTDLTIINGPKEGPDGQGGTLIWWEVQDEATGNEGWVAEQYLDAS